MPMLVQKILMGALLGIASISSSILFADEAPECTALKLTQIQKQFEAVVHESMTSCIRPNGPHTTAQFEAKLSEKKILLKNKIGDRKAGKIQRSEENLWTQLGKWSNDTNQETSDLFGLLFNDADQHLNQYKSCGAKLYSLTSSKDDWNPKESRAVLNAIKCIQKGSSEAYGKYFNNLEGFVSTAKKSENPTDRKSYDRSRKLVLSFFRDLRELSYITRCTEQRQKRDRIASELRACKQNIATAPKDNSKTSNTSVPDCIPTESTPPSKGAQELHETAEKLRGTERIPSRD